MPLPNKIKKKIPLTQSKTLYPRRVELKEMIEMDGTYLPKSLLHADLDRGFLDFVKDELRCVVEGKTIPTVDILISTQNWSQFVETWDFQNIDKNAEPPFITIIRTPEVKYGSNPALRYNIPNRRQYYYAQVPTWDGQRHGMDIYKIPQPVPVDIKYTVAIICNRMRELNKFNQIVLEKFSSRQAYQVIKGHYIPIINDDISDESVMDLEKRKVYIQKYTFTMLGFLIDEDQFEIQPAVTRILQMYETDITTPKRRLKREEPPPPSVYVETYPPSGSTQSTYTFDYTTNLKLSYSNNVDNFDVFINGDFYGNTLEEIQINTGDVLTLNIIKYVISDNAVLSFVRELI
jgi:hypothetical protein